MGNAYSENQKCECLSATTSSSTSRRRSSGTWRQEVCSVETVSSVNLKGSRRSRTRSLNLGESKMEVDTSEKEKPLSRHNYNLRPKTKTKMKGGSSSSTDCVPENNNEKYTRNRFLKDDVLAMSLDKLSLESATTTNRIDNVKETSPKKGRRRKSKDKLSETNAVEEPDADEDNEEGLQLPKHVLYYGYFFSTETSTVINKVVMYYFRLCYTEVPQFERFIMTCCKDADIRDPFEYYKRPGKRVKPTDELEYHITAKFLGREPDPPYQTLVHPFLQKMFYIRLIGIVFTAKSLGVRVKLSPTQQLIFDEKTDSKAGCMTPEKINGISDANIQNQIQNELEGYSQALRKHKKAYPHCKLKKTGTGEGNDKNNIFFKRSGDPLSLRTTTSRAHITIGCAPNVKAMQTGEDLVDVIDLEQRAATSSDSNFQQDFKIERGVLRQFGKHANAFVFYSDTDMIVPGRFDVFI